jgi:predicted CXXCH cytochrome family protein
LGHTFLARSLGLFFLFAAALPLEGQSSQGYVGAQACAKCHTTIQHEWAESRHAKMMQLATESSVKGDFAQTKLELHGAIYLLENKNNNFFITESDLTGKLWQHRVEYTLGERRLQHYLTTLPDGRIIVLPPTWDILRKKWVHELDVDNPEASGADIQIWNKSCYGCHVSREEKNFDLENLRYHTTWQDLGINCESCHGPGSEHIAKASSVKAMDAATKASVKAAILNPVRLDPIRSTMVCAQCHSFRDVYAEGFPAGANYYDYFVPVMEYRLGPSDDPAYWPDGRPRWYSNEALGLWQSECFLKGGATCVTCHSRAHSINIDRNPQLRRDNNALCTGCHKALATNVAAHTHHPAGSPGSSCIECHMPATVVGLNARMRDHSLSVPVPENTIRHNIPNACNLCHQDKDAQWTLQRMTTWYGENQKSQQELIARADAFTEARNGDATAIPSLLQILSDPSGGPFIRANAAGYLGNFPNDPSAYDAVLQAFKDGEPLVRATAAEALKPRAAQREAVAPELVALLKDPVRGVRLSAATALVAMGVRPFPGEDGERFERAKEIYATRADLNSDDAGQQLAAGKFYFLSGNLDRAAAAFRATLKLDPTIPAQYYLARTLAEKGDMQEARKILSDIPENDPQYNAAQRLLAEIEAKESAQAAAQPESSAAQSGAQAQAKFLDGQLLYQQEYYGAALQDFEEALQLAPQAEWATKAQVYRAICLEKLGRTSEAEAAIQALSGKLEARNDLDLQLAYAELLYETGRAEEALKQIDAVIGTAPQAPMAYFWRGKVLLQLHRIDEAAKAEEESIRLLPEFPPAHNLLVRIYQLQGRTKEAAEQAAWLRDYQRRMESR